MEQELQGEWSKIEKRISSFLDGIRVLKKNGKTPSLISISDSTGSDFADEKDFSFGNEYTPRIFALLIHFKITDGLSKIFK